MDTAEYALRRQTEAARDLVFALRSQGEEDAVLEADAVEGETGLHEAIFAALDEIDECDMIEAGCAAKVAELESRKVSAQLRRDRIRASIERAMVTLDLPTMRLATATLSLGKRAAQPVIDNEAEIPSRFFTVPETPAPKLDKKALTAALAEGAIAGAHLDNGSVSLSIRRK